MACVDACSHNALSPYEADDGHLYVRVDEDACVGCHRCEGICPVAAEMPYSTNELSCSRAFAAYCTEETLYSRSTSGGLFAAMAAKFMAGGGWVCGVVMDGDKANHIVSRNPADIVRMQGSKYLQSHTAGIYRQIGDRLRNGDRVLFCGMGCQAAAVCSFFKSDRHRDNLFVVDMICGGVPSALLVRRFLEGEPEWKAIAGFRRKGEYVLSCIDGDGDIHWLEGRRTLPLTGFLSGLTNRYSCAVCRFCGVERLSDITIGDYWGDAGKLQRSVAIVHSDKGMHLLQGLDNVELFPVDWNFVRHNYRCATGGVSMRWRLQRRMLANTFRHLSYKSLCSLYGCDAHNLFLLAIWAYNKAVEKVERAYIMRRTNKIADRLQQQNNVKQMRTDCCPPLNGGVKSSER